MCLGNQDLHACRHGRPFATRNLVPWACQLQCGPTEAHVEQQLLQKKTGQLALCAPLSSFQVKLFHQQYKLLHAGVGKPFFEFGTEPPACQLQCWSLEPYLKQWLLQEEATRNMPSDHATGAFLGSLVGPTAPSFWPAC